MKKNKLLALLMVLAMVLCFAACGETAPATTPDTDPATEDQAKIDADYTQLLTFAQAVSDHEASIANITAMKEGLLDGSVSEEEALDAYKALSEDSATIFAGLSEAQWQTEYYAEQIDLLLKAVDALSLADAGMYQAAVDNDASMMEEAASLYTVYNEQMDAFLTKMGA